VSDVVQFKKTARRRWSPAAPKPLVSEIMDALHDLGGQAHRDLVFNYIAANRTNSGVRPPMEFFDDLIAAFDDHLDSYAAGTRLLTLPFGRESRRWALSHEGMAQLRHRTRSTRLI
jgi:hypothetical protein